MWTCNNKQLTSPGARVQGMSTYLVLACDSLGKDWAALCSSSSLLLRTLPSWSASVTFNYRSQENKSNHSCTVKVYQPCYPSSQIQFFKGKTLLHICTDTNLSKQKPIQSWLICSKVAQSPQANSTPCDNAPITMKIELLNEEVGFLDMLDGRPINSANMLDT